MDSMRGNTSISSAQRWWLRLNTTTARLISVVLIMSSTHLINFGIEQWVLIVMLVFATLLHAVAFYQARKIQQLFGDEYGVDL